MFRFKLAIFTTLTMVNLVSGQMFLEMLNPEVGKLKTSINYELSYHCDRNIKQDEGGLSSFDHSLSILVPIQQDDSQEFALTSNLGLWDIDSQVRFPSKGPQMGDSLPEKFWNVEVGGLYRRKFENNWLASLSFNIGSPSNKPFDSFDELAVNAMGMLTMPTSQSSAWILMFYLSAPNAFAPGIPIPGVAYYWKPVERADVILGIPFAMGRWGFDPGLQLNGFIAPYTAFAELTYDLNDTYQLYTGFEWKNSEYLRAERRQYEYAVFYFEKNINAGLRFPIDDNIFMDFQTGFSFDRFIFEGEDYDDRNRHRLDISDGFYGRINTVLKF